MDEYRDRLIYRTIHWFMGEVDASALLDPIRHPRNSTLKMRSLHAEIALEMIGTVTAERLRRCARRRHPHMDPSQPPMLSAQGELTAASCSSLKGYCRCALLYNMHMCAQCFFVWRLGISRNGHDRPATVPLLLSALIQLSVQCMQTLSTCCWYTVVDRRPLQRVSLLRMQGWSLVITCMTATVWGSIFADAAPSALGKLAHSRADWPFLTQAVAAELNVSTICARFPEARGFVGAHC
jgi:hypothetical protein